MTDKLYLVMGGTGFIGSHVVDKLLEQGCKVRVFSRNAEKFRALPKDVEYVWGSFDDTFAMAEALQGVSVVIHAITTSLPGTSNLNIKEDIRSNLLNTVQLLELCVQKDIEHLCFLSSGGTVYGVAEEFPIKETHPLAPLNSYGILKATIENYIRMYHKLNGIDYTILRITNPYGPRQGHIGTQGFIGSALNKIANNQTINIWGDGSIIRDFIYIEDTAEIVAQTAIEKNHGTYNIGSGDGVNLNKVLAIISEVTEISPKITYESGRNIDVPVSYVDTSKALEKLGWSSKTTLKSGIDKHWKWIKEFNQK